ncbi:predicted protein [Histoplasma capsulatum var. duboisii H88]|uniref:Predicted protein n=1 Tax=Ajellomyces capsulatus (strain H88) TaxID=544711 RepID=F0U5A3_AJEC8|nr:predicted protein [Histoplasma capsulatum var. duboisii H88]
MFDETPWAIYQPYLGIVPGRNCRQRVSLVLRTVPGVTLPVPAQPRPGRFLHTAYTTADTTGVLLPPPTTTSKYPPTSHFHSPPTPQISCLQQLFFKPLLPHVRFISTPFLALRLFHFHGHPFSKPYASRFVLGCHHNLASACCSS